MLNYLRGKWQSLVFRLLFYFLISILALAIVLAISFVQRLRPHVQNQILPNVERYIEYLLDDIGDPPDLLVAQRVLESCLETDRELSFRSGASSLPACLFQPSSPQGTGDDSATTDTVSICRR
jgi:hypothetical protein